MRILYLEDEHDIATGVVELLRTDRYEVVWVDRLDAAYDALAAAPFDLALLDVMIGSDDAAGFTFAANLRAAGFAGHVLFVSARDAVSDRVRGLDLGGDDYLVKPFSGDELRARVRALLRRIAPLKQTVLERGRLRIDLAQRTVSLDGQVVDLREREFAMLEFMAHEPDRPIPVEELLDRLFPNALSGPTVVRVYVSTLRKKLGDDVVETVPGGYRLGKP